MSKHFEGALGKVFTVKDEVKTTYAQILKEKDEIKEKQKAQPTGLGDISIKKEDKEVISKNLKLLWQTLDMNNNREGR